MSAVSELGIGTSVRCSDCQAWHSPAVLRLGRCARCVSVRTHDGTWCDKHGPTDGSCLGCKVTARPSVVRIGSVAIDVAAHLGLAPGVRHEAEAKAARAAVVTAKGQAKLDEYAERLERDARELGPGWVAGEACEAARRLRDGEVARAMETLRPIKADSFEAGELVDGYREAEGVECRVCKSPDAVRDAAIILGEVAECACCGQPFVLVEGR